MTGRVRASGVRSVGRIVSRFRVLARFVAVAALAALAPMQVEPLAAQTDGTAPLATRDEPDPTPSASRGIAIRIAPTVRVAAAPRTVHVLTVPVPAALASADSVAFSVVQTRTAGIAGAREGTLMRAGSDVPLAISVPARAPAGRLRIGEVRFVDASQRGPTIIVPIELDIAVVHNVTLTPHAPLLTALPGERAIARVTITNAGNVDDTLRLVMVPPPGWRGDVPEPLAIIASGRAISREITLTPPRDLAPTTTSFVVYALPYHLPPSAIDRALAQVAITAEVVAPRAAAAFGPVLGVSYSGVDGGGVASASTWGLSLDGPIGRDVRVQMSWTQRAIGGTPGVARIGDIPLFPTLSLQHPRWRADVGNAGVSLSPLTGVVAQGRGIGAMVQDTAWRFDVLLARPYGLGLGDVGDGHFAAARLRVARDATAWTATASSLRDGAAFRGSLTALALGAERTLPFDLDAAGELAWRSWSTGSGLGASMDLAHRSRASDWRLRAQYAPGGSFAFARATTDVTFAGGQQLGAFRVGYLGWHVTDDGRSALSQVTDGASIVPQWRLGSRATIGADLRWSRSDGGTVDSRLGTQTFARGLFASGALGRVSVSVSGSRVDLARETRLDDFARSTAEAQYLATAQAALPTRVGVLDLFASHQQSGGDDALLVGQQSAQLRLEQMPVPLTDGRLRLSGGIGAVRNLGTGEILRQERVGVDARLPFALGVRVDVERNPLFGLGSGNGWMTAFRIERRFGAPSFLRLGRPGGTVFEDANANGIRDPGERGLPGVLVRVGAEVAITDAEGRFSLVRAQGGIAELDERSLPFGLMVPPRVTTGGARGEHALDIAVVPVGIVEVVLEAIDEPYVSGAPPALHEIIVMAVDGEGRRFFARSLGDGAFAFDALPPGDYTLELDASAVSEPVTMRDVSPRFRIGAMSGAQRLRVRVGPRRLRMFRAPSASAPAEAPASSGRPGRAAATPKRATTKSSAPQRSTSTGSTAKRSTASTAPTAARAKPARAS